MDGDNMYNTKIDENLIRLAETALKNNEFFEYLTGIGKYSYVINGQSYYNKRNDMITMIRGLELYNQKYNSSSLESSLNEQLLILADSNDSNKIFTALDFIKEYIYLKKSNQIKFNLNILPVLQGLRKGLVEHKNDMINKKDADFNRENGMWSFVESDSRFIERHTGHKIL